MDTPAPIQITPDGFELRWPGEPPGHAWKVLLALLGTAGFLFASLSAMVLLLGVALIAIGLAARASAEPVGLRRSGDQLVCERRVWRWTQELRFTMRDLAEVRLLPEDADSGACLLLRLRRGPLLVLRGLDDATLAWLQAELGATTQSR